MNTHKELIEWSAEFVGLDASRPWWNEEALYFPPDPTSPQVREVWNPLENIHHMAMVLEHLDSMPGEGIVGVTPKSRFDLKIWDLIPQSMKEEILDGEIPYLWLFKNPETLLKTIKEVVENE